jgi:6-phosphogluconolactonase
MAQRLLNIFPSPLKMAEKFAEELVYTINESVKMKKPFTIALSGGSTPELLFSELGDKFSKYVSWKYVHFFWGDERCVPPDDPESNYGMTRRTLLEKIEIPSSNVHRIRGEDDPKMEAERYSREISGHVLIKKGLPVFDLIILGLGEDGHTASIFPDNIELFNSRKICEEAVHPVTLKKRITITGPVINNAKTVAFLVTGKKKAAIVEKILKKSAEALDYPAAYVVPADGDIRWFLDESSASYL